MHTQAKLVLLDAQEGQGLEHTIRANLLLHHLYEAAVCHLLEGCDVCSIKPSRISVNWL